MLSQNCRIGGLEGTDEGRLVQCLCNEPKTLPINPYQGVKQTHWFSVFKTACKRKPGVCYFWYSSDSWEKRQTQILIWVLLKKEKIPKRCKTPKQQSLVTIYLFIFRKCTKHLWYINNTLMPLPMSTIFDLNLVTVLVRPIMKSQMTRKSRKESLFCIFLTTW